MKMKSVFLITAAITVSSACAQSATSSSQAAALAATQTPSTVPAQTQQEWVAAGAPAAQAATAAASVSSQDSAGARFPSQPDVVIAPPSQGGEPPPSFAGTQYGGQSYGGGGQAAQGQQNPQQQAVAQSLPAPPIITQAKQVISPFTPGEIRELHKDFNETRKASSERSVTIIPKISSISVDLSPGSSPPILRAMQGEPSSIVFLDSTGAPWPIAAPPRIANNTFDVEWLKGSPNLVIAAQSGYDSSGMAVFLVGLPTPIMIKLSSGEADSNAKTRAVDYRLDLRIPGRGPNAKSSLVSAGRIGMYDDALQAFLDGVPPSDAKHVAIEGERPAQTDVWRLGGSLYLRTPMDIRSAFDQTMASADGMHVYKLDPTPLIALSQGGQNLSLTLDIE